MTETTGAEMPEALLYQQIEAAARTLAECMDYPWAEMPETGKRNMRDNAVKVIHAALSAAAPAVAPNDLITIRKPTTPAEVAWLAKLAHLLVSDVNKTLDEVLASAPQQGETAGAVYAELPTRDQRNADGTVHQVTPMNFTRDEAEMFADATCALRAAAPHAAEASGAPVAAAPMSAPSGVPESPISLWLVTTPEGNTFTVHRRALAEAESDYAAKVEALQVIAPASPTTVQAVTDDMHLRSMWRAAGGNFYGPNVETGSMPEADLLPFLRSLITGAASGGEAQAEDAKDAARLDWLQEQASDSRTGISFDYTKYVEDGLVLEKGYRFMRRHQIGERHSTLREAIDAAMAAESQKGAA